MNKLIALVLFGIAAVPVVGLVLEWLSPPAPETPGVLLFMIFCSLVTLLLCGIIAKVGINVWRGSNWPWNT